MFRTLALALVLASPAVLQAQDSPSIKSYSRFDFVPGSQVVLLSDFSADAVGDFPGGWNTNAAGEVVTIEGKPGHWLKFTQGGIFLPDLPAVLPDNFTLEFDLAAGTPFTGGTSLSVNLVALESTSDPAPWQGVDNSFTFTLRPDGMITNEKRQNGYGEAANTVEIGPFAQEGRVVHVSVWRQRERVRVYVDERKVWDVPRAMLPDVGYNAVIFWVASTEPEEQYYLGNLRLAVGAPDTRSKLITEGRFTTRGILFDVNSDRIRAESYGTLKDIASVLTENPGVRVRIIGHTDSDGDEASNLDLSRRRAAAVKTMLAAEFGIDAQRMETDGRGESEPAESNATGAGKANNRRVEFVKL